MEATGPNRYKRYSKRQMMENLSKAEEYCDGEMVPCNWLYRNKPVKYLYEIFNENGGIMEPIMKDKSGDPRSPINGKLEGVFFTASVKRGSKVGKPLEKSPYGYSRFQVFIEYLFNPKDYRLYFADFYCAGARCHYVILVVAEINSEADIFCWHNLPLLQWNDNKFLTCNDETFFNVTDSKFCIIELFYTNEVNITKALIRGKAEILCGFPTCRRSQEVHKNLNCSICNAFSPSENKVRGQPPIQLHVGHNMKQMKILLSQAENYCDGEMVPCNWLYRNKPEEYFSEIFHQNEGIMEPTWKDSNGDPKSPINDRIEGIFFTASVSRGSKCGKPLKRSPYGSSRFQVDIEYLIDPENCRLYFADFYCTGSDYHYVTLVVVKKHSDADRFCWNNLPLLQWDDNEFLTYDEEDLFDVTDSDLCIIQVFYCDEVNLGRAVKRGRAEFHEVPLCKTSKKTCKDLKCLLCNPFHNLQFPPGLFQYIVNCI